MNNPTNTRPDPLDEALKNYFGLSYLFPYQRLVISNILEAAEKQMSDRDIPGKQIVILPTGAGKSLCFQLPAMMIEGITLVIYPILSLMADQQRRLEEITTRTEISNGINLSPVIIRGGQSKEARDEIWRKLESGQSKFIIANPEVLLTKQVKERLEKIKIMHVVIDEAHCVSEWGESFRPAYLEIGAIVNLINPPLVTAFTATASAPVLEKIKKYIFNGQETNQIMGNPDRPNIYYSANGCINRDLAVRDLLAMNKRPAIVFCSSRPGTEKLARYLRNELNEIGHYWHNEIRFYHAGLSKEEKTLTERWFINNREAVLCATCAYGMGIDKSDIRTIIHRDCAPSIEAYLQESGRAGRDGEQSKAVLLWGPDDEAALARAKNGAERDRLSVLLDYARNTSGCRRHSLLNLLNFDSGSEVPEKACCDICCPQDKTVTADHLREEAAVLKFFRKNKKRFTQTQAASILAACITYRWSQEEASRVIGHLIKTKKLRRLASFPWKDKITL
ncbi:MAG: RecQ family ATP-dependent DNA helicase [Treponema sp.]|nr:RecQ family ATP-dependent DNA helicase [Treponema sp.]